MVKKKRTRKQARDETDDLDQIEGAQDEDEQEEDEEQEEVSSRARIKVVAAKMAFDGLRRVRPGETVTIEVATDDNGDPIMPKWATTPDEWKEQQEQEAEEAKNVRRPVRGGVSGREL